VQISFEEIVQNIKREIIGGELKFKTIFEFQFFSLSFETFPGMLSFEKIWMYS
jgi:hypothetical protein